jgi:hypothetical protein
MTDRKSLLALRGVGPESEAESVRFHGRRVTKVGPEVKSCRRGLGAAEQGVQEAHLGAAGRFRWRRRQGHSAAGHNKKAVHMCCRRLFGCKVERHAHELLGKGGVTGKIVLARNGSSLGSAAA